MIRVGHASNPALATGKTFCGRAVQQVPEGYIIKFGEKYQHTGIALTSDKLTAGKELIFKVVGQRNGQVLLHPVFAGFR